MYKVATAKKLNNTSYYIVCYHCLLIGLSIFNFSHIQSLCFLSDNDLKILYPRLNLFNIPYFQLCRFSLSLWLIHTLFPNDIRKNQYVSYYLQPEHVTLCLPKISSFTSSFQKPTHTLISGSQALS